jgi:hypothetical protein
MQLLTFITIASFIEILNQKNVFLLKDGTIKLADFGLSRIIKIT